jgi:hypothetical protein
MRVGLEAVTNVTERQLLADGYWLLAGTFMERGGGFLLQGKTGVRSRVLGVRVVCS